MISTKVPAASCNENKQICEGNFFWKIYLITSICLRRYIINETEVIIKKDVEQKIPSLCRSMNIKMSSHAQNNLIQNESFATKKKHQRNFIIWNLQRFKIVSYLKYAGPTICFSWSYTLEKNLKCRSTKTQWNESPVQEFYY